MPERPGARPRRERTSPCIGVCSTTFGDLVCRGCKRFAHEVVDWNGYEPEQRQAIWRRLAELRDASVAGFLSVTDAEALEAAAARMHIVPVPEQTLLTLAYETLRRTRGAPDFAALGLATSEAGAAVPPAELFATISREFLTRSTAAYERNFRIPAE
ncbi:MAG: DUF1289 domain-containing protein [Gammaproteobacteria bacterium]|nr:DUF1289 domain-containing protein [Gammaproteobacteria bacterium]